MPLQGKRSIQAADLFAGAGGFSTGLLDAAKALGLEVELLAINHWQVAIDTHSLNHKSVRHMCQSLESINPRDVVPGGKLHILLASPECLHFSTARGGKPMSDQSRASAWCILRWLDALDVENVVIENVPEFQSWGPLHPEDHRDPKKRNRPIQREKGRFFRNFIRNLRTLGYRVDYRVLNAADYGAATTRRRLFILARKGRKPIQWPEPTHARPVPEAERPQRDLGLTAPRRPWRPAREIIDWSIRGESIYTRKRPLAPNTLARIYAGLQKFSGLAFILPHQHGTSGTGNVRGVDGPLPTVTGTSSDMFLAQPFLVVLRNHCDGKSIDGPIPTVAANGNHIYLAEPFLVGIAHRGGNGSYVYDLDRPVPTVTTQAEIGLAEPFLVAVNHGPEHRSQALDDPLPTITGKGTQALIQPFLLGQQSCGAPRSVEDPAPTVAGAGAISLVKPYIRGAHEEMNYPHGDVSGFVPYLVEFYGERNGQEPRCRSVDRPLGTVAGSRTHGLAQPFMIRYHGTDRNGHSVDEPVPTLTARDRLALVHPQLVRTGEVSGPIIGYLDILFRMLQLHELAAAMSFPRHYVFTGTREQGVKQVGNAVDVRQATALCQAVLS